MKEENKYRIIRNIFVIIAVIYALKLGYNIGYDKGKGLPTYYISCDDKNEVEQDGWISYTCNADDETLKVYVAIKK